MSGTALLLEVAEHARRVAFAFNGKHSKREYRERWADFLPQHESLLALDAALTELDAKPLAERVAEARALLAEANDQAIADWLVRG